MFPISLLYNTFKNTKKERFAIILEPLQAILQLSLLSFAPIDTKLTIHNNILYMQTPCWNQSVIRTYNNDSKTDLFYLFNVFIRFNKFYQHLKNYKNDRNDRNDMDRNNIDIHTNFFELLKELSTKGIDKLLQTYKQTDNPALLHTLNIYKKLLNNPEQQEQQQQTTQFSEINPCSALAIGGVIDNVVPDINNVFCSITKLYTEYDLLIIFNTIQLIIHNPNNYIEYSEGLNKILEPINKQIQKWIVDNIVY